MTAAVAEAAPEDQVITPTHALVRPGPDSQIDWIVFGVAWVGLFWQAAWLYWLPREVGVLAGALGCVAAWWIVARRPNWRSSGNFAVVTTTAGLAIVAFGTAAFVQLHLQVFGDDTLSRFSPRSREDLRITYGIGGGIAGICVAWIAAAIAVRGAPDAERSKCGVLIAGAFFTAALVLASFLDADHPQKSYQIGVIAALVPLIWIGVMRWPVGIVVATGVLVLMTTAESWWARAVDMVPVAVIVGTLATGFGVLLFRHRDVPARVVAGFLVMLGGLLLALLPDVRTALGRSGNEVWVGACAMLACAFVWAYWTLRHSSIEVRALLAGVACALTVIALATGDIVTTIVGGHEVFLGICGAVAGLWYSAFYISTDLAWSYQGNARTSPPLRFRIARFGLDLWWFTPAVCAWLMLVGSAFILDRPVRKDMLMGFGLDAWIKDAYLWPDAVKFDLRVDLLGIRRSGDETLSARIDRSRDRFSMAVRYDKSYLRVYPEEAVWRHHDAHGFTCLADARGSLVLDVTPGLPAAQAGLTRGSVLSELRFSSGTDKSTGPPSCDASSNDQAFEVVVAGRKKGVQSIRIDPDATVVGPRTAPERAFVTVFPIGERRTVVVKGLLWGTAVQNNSRDLDEFTRDLMTRAWRLEPDELVLDLRLAQGRMVVRRAADVAAHILGDTANGKAFLRTSHNETYRMLDRAFVLKGVQDMRLKRIVALTSRTTCGAGEALINGLRAYLDVVTIGDQTCGRPYEFDEWEHRGAGDGESVFLVTKRVNNAKGESDYDEGIAPTCRIADDLSIPAGANADPVLREALHYLSTGRCSTATDGKPGAGENARKTAN